MKGTCDLGKWRRFGEQRAEAATEFFCVGGGAEEVPRAKRKRGALGDLVPFERQDQGDGFVGFVLLELVDGGKVVFTEWLFDEKEMDVEFLADKGGLMEVFDVDDLDGGKAALDGVFLALAAVIVAVKQEDTRSVTKTARVVRMRRRVTHVGRSLRLWKGTCVASKDETSKADRSRRIRWQTNTLTAIGGEALGLGEKKLSSDLDDHFNLFYKQGRFVGKKPRVRAVSSDRVVGLKNDRAFRLHGVKGAKLPCGVWGETPRNKSNCVSPFISRDAGQIYRDSFHRCRCLWNRGWCIVGGRRLGWVWRDHKRRKGSRWGSWDWRRKDYRF